MNPKLYHLQISAKTQLFNFFRKLFIVSGIDKLLPALTRHSNMNTFAAKLIPPNYLYSPGSVRTVEVDGIKLKLDISDTVGHSNYFAINEPAQIVLYNFVKPDMNVIDIGANIGATTLNLAKKVGAMGKVFSFEPSPYNYQNASQNISLNNFSNIKLINQGLGKEKASAFLYNVNSNNRGMSRLLKENENNNLYEKTSVEIDTLDNSMVNFSVPPPSFIKIDVEGYEFNVLLGGKETIRKYRPALFIELDDNNLREQGNTAKELIQLILQFQYKIINAATGGLVNENTNFINCHFDILCIPAEEELNSKLK
ncbi:MAG TPA: FkbM family methyltransferase [Ginsengibacter sp.]